MQFRSKLTIAVLLATGFAAGGCRPADPVAGFIERQDSLPPDQRVPDWDRTRRLMLRRAPAVGEAAPDFTLAALDGSGDIRRSAFHESRPLVLIFGSFT